MRAPTDVNFDRSSVSASVSVLSGRYRASRLKRTSVEVLMRERVKAKILSPGA